MKMKPACIILPAFLLSLCDCEARLDYLPPATLTGSVYPLAMQPATATEPAKAATQPSWLVINVGASSPAAGAK